MIVKHLLFHKTNAKLAIQNGNYTVTVYLF